MNFTKHIFLFLIGCAGIMPALAQQTYIHWTNVFARLFQTMFVSKMPITTFQPHSMYAKKPLPNTFLRLALREADLCQTRDYLKWK